ncbi:MAG: HD-GYP domain-containing protein [Gemmiger sp.]|nr:HD-GYP domain-containing protein [Gemmiger sp.]
MGVQKSIVEYHDLIEAIVAAVEMRDFHTAHHSERVSNMTQVLCEALQLTAEETNLYHIAADLHDIGKIGVPDAVLLKKGALDEHEWQQMKAHTEIGSYILRKVERFAGIAGIVRHHHERWDGKGYPDAIAGDSIPFGARIIAVADSMDAMLSDRSYRKAMPEAVCKAEIEKNRGRMYDPLVADAALQRWDALLQARKTGLTTKEKGWQDGKNNTEN